MKELDDLNTFEKSILLVCCDANNFSLRSHVPIEAIKRRIRNVPDKYIKKSIRILFSNGFIVKHPTGRSRNTIQHTKKGLKAGNLLKKEQEKIK